MNIHLASNIGEGPTELAAFDSALIRSGIANYNLLRLSSVIPPDSIIIEHEQEQIPKEVMPGQWGDRLYVVMAEKRTSIPHTEAWAGVGWVQDEESKKGLFVEHEGESESKVREDIEASLGALMTSRCIDFGPISMRVIGAKCKDKPICAMAVAVYQASDWENKPFLAN